MATLNDVLERALALRATLLKQSIKYKELRIEVLIKIISQFFSSPYSPEVLYINSSGEYPDSIFKSVCESTLEELELKYKFIHKEISGSAYSFVFKFDEH